MFDFRYSKHISFIRCKFANIGYTAIHASMVYNFNVQHCTFKDVGNMPLTVGYNGNIQHKYATRRVNIKRNTFEGCGVYTMYQPSCIHVKGIARISVHDNDVSMSSYAGIRAGWQNTFAPDYNNKRSVFSIKRNHIHHYGNGILNDFAGVYMSSNMLDCGIKQNMSVCHLHARVEENAIHHSRAFYYGAIGVYSDTAASSIKVTKNWIYKLSDCAVNFHCGQNNAAVNNMIYHTSAKRVFGLCNRSVGPHGRMPKQTMEFSKNVIYLNVTGAHLYGRGDKWNNDAPTVRRNNYYFKGFSQQQFDRFFSKTYRTWRDWNRVARMDRGSIIANPRFVNVNRDDYRLSKRSPARKMIWSVDLRNVVKRSGACFG
uniref:Right handed beta helix domain-containing protein n=1 Tax=Ciona savignyi TaxID=51511 RepID=H2YH07_CIOSA